MCFSLIGIESLPAFLTGKSSKSLYFSGITKKVLLFARHCEAPVHTWVFIVRHCEARRAGRRAGPKQS